MNKPKNKKQLLLEKIKTLVKEKSVVEELEQELFQTDKISAEEPPDVSNKKIALETSTLLNNLPGMVYRCLKDKHWTMLFVNSACYDLTGYRPEELIKNSKISFAQLIHPDDREVVNAEIHSKTKNGKFFIIEYRVLDKDGNQIWVREKGRLAGKDENGVSLIEGFIMDITDEVEAEIALKASEETYRNLFHNAQVGLFRSGIEDGQILESNDQLAKMFGYNHRKEFINHFVASEYYVSPERRDEMLKELKQKGEIQNFEARFKRKDGTEFVALYSARLFPEQGWLEGLLEDITEREKAKEKLIESEKLLKKAQSIGKIGSWKFDLNNHLVSASEESVRIYDLTPKKEYTIQEVQQCALPEYRKMLDAALKNLITGRQNYNVEFKIKRPSNGEIIDIRSIAEYNTVENSVVGVIQNITESKLAEKLLKDNEEMYRSLIENSNDAIYILYNRKFEIVNSGFEKMLGFDVEDLKKMDFDPIDFIAPESRPYIRERINKLQKGEEVEPRYEFTAITKHGEKKEVEASVAYIPFKEGTATQGIIRDMTERKQAEKKIKSLSEFRSLLVELSANFINVAAEKTDSSVNKSLARLGSFVGVDRAYIFEYSFDKGTAKNTFEWCRDGVQPQIDELREVPLNVAPEWVERHTDGEIMHIPDISKMKKNKLQQMLEAQGIKSLLSIPLFNENECTGFVGFDAVRKHFRFSEDEIEILKIYAKILVNSFERQKRKKELVLAKEKAEESDRLKSAFLANMSHEIRTPMNGIMGFTNFLKEPHVSEDKIKHYVEVINESGERMLSTINDIISISKIESGTLEVNSSEFDLNREIDYLFNFFKPEANKKSLKLKAIKELSDAEAKIKTDREKFGAVFINLIKNAVKYTDEGLIEFGYFLQDDQFHFFVKDTGIGIEKDKQKLIFERFVQEDTSFSKPYEGAGLGLSIAKGYLEMMGGKIWVESEKGKGSAFFFTISSAG